MAILSRSASVSVSELVCMHALRERQTDTEREATFWAAMKATKTEQSAVKKKTKKQKLSGRPTLGNDMQLTHNTS